MGTCNGIGNGDSCSGEGGSSACNRIGNSDSCSGDGGGSTCSNSQEQMLGLRHPYSLVTLGQVDIVGM